MKGMVFTTDAIFALVIVGVAVSILAYFNYAIQVPYTAGSSTISQALSVFSSESPALLSATDQAALSILNGYNSSSEFWTQFMGGPSRSAYEAHGPILPTIQYVFSASAAISTPIVAGYGNVYFGAGNTLYALNASYGSLSWSNTLASSVYGLALYNGALIYGTSSNTGALNAGNGTSMWSSSTASSQALAYGGELYSILSTGARSTNLMVSNANNGTLMLNNNLGTNINEVLEENGSVLVWLTSNNVVLLDQAGGNVLTSSYAFATTNIAASGGMLYVGNTVFACSFYLNLTQKFCDNDGSTVTGVAANRSLAVYENESGVTAFSGSGALLWGKSLSSYGTPLQYPLLTNSSVYSVWSGNYVINQNATTGAVQWSTQVPSTYGAVSQFSAAYGDLYVAAGGNFIAYGPCSSQPYSSLLQNIVQLYLEGRGSCATYLVDKAYPKSNTGLFINGSYAPSLYVSSFNGQSSYVSTGTTGLPLGNNPSSVFMWAYTPTPNAHMDIFSYGTNGGTSEMAGLYTGGSDLDFWNGVTSYTTSLALSSDEWHFLGYTYSNGNLILYLNSNSNSMSIPSQNIVLPASNPSVIGGGTGSLVLQFPWNGLITNVQFYNTALNSTQVRQLYDEGISGAPVASANIVGWWPLEGDANDYSGYNNTGYPFGVTYVQGNYLPAGYSGASSISVSSTLVPFNKYAGFNGANSLYTNVPKLYKVGVYSWK